MSLLDASGDAEADHETRSDFGESDDRRPRGLGEAFDARGPVPATTVTNALPSALPAHFFGRLNFSWFRQIPLFCRNSIASTRLRPALATKSTMCFVASTMKSV